jgi:beta-lactam-binding protein with PASTA domain
MCFLSDQAGDVSLQATFDALCIMPDVVGMTLARAEVAITHHHCGLGTVKHVFSRRVRKGRVVSESPSWGLQRAPGAKVNVVVSKGRRRG